MVDNSEIDLLESVLQIILIKIQKSDLFVIKIYVLQTLIKLSIQGPLADLAYLGCVILSNRLQQGNVCHPKAMSQV
jgi:hypothetical protein